MKRSFKKLLAYMVALCVSLAGFGLSVHAESDDEKLHRSDGDATAEITRVECCGSMNTQYVEVGTPLEDIGFGLSVWFEGEEDASGNYLVTPDEITGYDPSAGVKDLTIAVTIHGKPYEFHTDITVLPSEEYRENLEIHWLIWCYYQEMMTSGYVPDDPDKWLDKHKNWTIGNFNYVGQITPENADTLFCHAYFTEYSANGSDFWDTYHDDETNDFIIPRADMEKMFAKVFAGSPEGLTASSMYHPETDTFQYGLQGYGGGGPGRYTYEKSLDSDGNTVIRYTPEISDICAHCNYPTETCNHNIDLVLSPDGRIVSIELMPREIRLESSPRTTYQAGEAFDVEGAAIRAIYDDKRSETVPLTSDMVSGFDPNKAGQQKLLIRYKRQSLPLTAEVKAADIPFDKGDADTGVKIEAEPGVVPPDTTIQVEEVKEGGNFTIINDALAQTSHKWVAYDISLQSNNVKIQPNGKVKVTIPRPMGLNKNKMVLYHVADDGTLTQIPFTLDDKGNVVFETDHFSLYVVAEKIETDSGSSNPPTGYSGQAPLLWSIASLVLAASALTFLSARRQKFQK